MKEIYVGKFRGQLFKAGVSTNPGLGFCSSSRSVKFKRSEIRTSLLLIKIRFL